jgi:TctA family transporter
MQVSTRVNIEETAPIAVALEIVAREELSFSKWTKFLPISISMYSSCSGFAGARTSSILFRVPGSKCSVKFSSFDFKMHYSG